MEIRKLNSLRGIAAMIVVISHFGISTKMFDGILFGSGQFGVMLFFILSGFLMSYLYIDLKCDRINFKKYIISRVARVFPLFLVVVVLSYLLQKLGIDGILFKINSFNLFLSHVTFMNGISVLWTIPTEIQFYIIFLLICISLSYVSFKFVELPFSKYIKKYLYPKE